MNKIKLYYSLIYLSKSQAACYIICDSARCLLKCTPPFTKSKFLFLSLAAKFLTSMVEKGHFANCHSTFNNTHLIAPTPMALLQIVLEYLHLQFQWDNNKRTITRNATQ